MNEKSVDSIKAALNTLRSTGRQPTGVRMHPLDIQWMRRRYLDTGTSALDTSVLFGLPIEPDCAVERGKPKPIYERRP